MPALLTSTSTPPKAASAASNIPRTALASLTSALAVSARPPAGFDLASQRIGGLWHRRIVDDDGEAVGGETLATAAPMPREAPVTIATLLVLSVISLPYSRPQCAQHC